MIHNNHLTDYLNELSYYNNYDETENIEYLKRYVNGEKDLLDEIFERNLFLVIKCAKKFFAYTKTTNLDKMDLVQTGNLALLDAIKTFDFSYNTTFSTWAGFLIEKKIKELIWLYGYSIKIRQYNIMQIRDYNNKYDLLTKELGREPTIHELSVSLGKSEKKVISIQILKSVQNSTSLNIPISEDGDELIKLIKDDKNHEYDDLFKKLLLEQTKDFLLNVLQQVNLTDIQYKVMILRYGLLDGKVRTQMEVADALNVCKQYVSNIEKVSLKKIIKSKYIFELALHTENPVYSLKMLGYEDNIIKDKLAKIKKL